MSGERSSRCSKSPIHIKLSNVKVFAPALCRQQPDRHVQCVALNGRGGLTKAAIAGPPLSEIFDARAVRLSLCLAAWVMGSGAQVAARRQPSELCTVGLRCFQVT